MNKTFIVEAETLKEAMDLVENQLIQDVDFNSLEIDRLGFNFDDPSIREYNRKKALEIFKKQRLKESENS